MKKPLEVLKLYADHDYTLNGTLASRAALNLQSVALAQDVATTSLRCCPTASM